MGEHTIKGTFINPPGRDVIAMTCSDAVDALSLPGDWWPQSPVTRNTSNPRDAVSRPRRAITFAKYPSGVNCRAAGKRGSNEPLGGPRSGKGDPDSAGLSRTARTRHVAKATADPLPPLDHPRENRPTEQSEAARRRAICVPPECLDEVRRRPTGADCGNMSEAEE